MYGHDVAEVLRHVRGVKAPIFLFSSFHKSELKDAILAAPVDGRFNKSQGLDPLLSAIRATLGTP